MSVSCVICNRSFARQQALDQHVRDSPAHLKTFYCDACDRSFSSQDALDRHIRDSPAHTQRFDCNACDRSFSSQGALDQHMRDSPAHTQTFDCDACDRSFSSQDVLDQHMCDSQLHQQIIETPLDTFFLSFLSFDYNSSLPPATSYANLQKHMGWRQGQTESNEAWADYQNALESELRMWYGQEDDLTAWHALCRAIGIIPLPKTCGQCQQVLHSLVDTVRTSAHVQDRPHVRLTLISLT